MKRTAPIDVEADLGFLTTELGFDAPVSKWVSRDHVTTYTRGDVEVSATWDGAPWPIGRVRVGGNEITTWHLSAAAIGQLIRDHGEILLGDLSPLAAAEADARRAARYAADPRLAEVEIAFRQAHGGQPGIADIVCGRDPIRRERMGIWVSVKRGAAPVRLPKTFRGYAVRRLYQDRQGTWRVASER